MLILFIGCYLLYWPFIPNSVSLLFLLPQYVKDINFPQYLAYVIRQSADKQSLLRGRGDRLSITCTTKSALTFSARDEIQRKYIKRSKRHISWPLSWFLPIWFFLSFCLHMQVYIINCFSDFNIPTLNSRLENRAIN